MIWPPSAAPAALSSGDFFQVSDARGMANALISMGATVGQVRAQPRAKPRGKRGIKFGEMEMEDVDDS